MVQSRMRGEDRRESILRAALPVFAKQGFANTTTKDLAEAAGVSEALLYRHFPSKESLYEAIQELGCAEHDLLVEKLGQLPPSTSTLVQTIYFLMRSLIIGNPTDPIGSEIRNRLIINSCLGDGGYTRHLFKGHYDCCFARLEECLKKAAEMKDLEYGSDVPRTRLHFVHHLACMIAVLAFPEKPIIDYKLSREELLNEAVLFVLRGLGLTEKAIATYYNPKALALFIELVEAERLKR
jgi:TetR/AcrR family transcriptional regulator, transcriptional repressor of aconitase